LGAAKETSQPWLYRANGGASAVGSTATPRVTGADIEADAFVWIPRRRSAPLEASEFRC
jgi:hypothetical protein